MTCIDLTPLAFPRASWKRPRGRLRGLLYLLGVLAALAIAGRASAQEPAVEACQDLRAEAEGQPDPLRLEHEGIPGMWFPMPVARLMLCEVRELRIRRRDAVLVDRELRLWGLQVDFVGAQLSLAVEARDRLEGVVTAAERRAREAEERADHWTRSPFLWMTVGAVVAGVLFAGAIAALDAIRE